MEVFLVMVGSDLEVHEHDPWVLHGILDRPKEGDSLTTVDQAMVIREGNVHHRPDHNLKCKGLRLVQKKGNSTWPFLTTGLSKTPCIPRIADCGGLMIGVPNREPNTPPLLQVVNEERVMCNEKGLKNMMLSLNMSPKLFSHA